MRKALMRLTKGSLIYGLGGMMQRFMVVLLLPFYTQVLTPEDYGVVALVSLVAVAMNGLLSLGTTNSLSVLYFKEDEVDKRPTIIWTNILLLILNGIFWYALSYMAAPLLSYTMFQSEHYAYLIRLAILGAIFGVVADPLLAYLRMEEKAAQYVILTVTGSFISIAMSVWLVLVNKLGSEGLILATTITQVAMLLINLVVIGRKLNLRFDLSLFSPLVRVGFPSIFGLLAFLVIDYADRQMIERIVSIDALGIYSLGYSFGLFMTLATGAFATSWPPFFMSYVNKIDEAQSVFARVLTYYLIIFGLLTVLFFVFAKPIVYIIMAEPFHQAYLIVGIVAAAMLLKGCYLIMLPGIYFAEKLQLQVVVEWVAAIINLAMNLLLIPRFGITGAALATLISYLCLPVMTWFISKRYLSVKYEWARVAKITVMVSLTCVLIYILSAVTEFIASITMLMNLGIFILLLITLYRSILTTPEKEKIWLYLK
jgi:O-antigen/teichoic acid export membrane protein